MSKAWTRRSVRSNSECVPPQGGGGGGAAGRGKLKLGQLAGEVQALRDVKHFVKDYQGHLPPAYPPSGNAPHSFTRPPAGVALQNH